MENIKDLHIDNVEYKLSNMKVILFSFLFSSLSLATIWVTHQFGLAGPVFLPMHFFILIAALSFGWRVGLLTGILVPIMSYFQSGMPILPILPRIILEVTAYGFFVGIFREKLKFNMIISLLLAMIIGRIFSGLGGLFFNGVSFFVHIFSIIKVGFLGIILQFLLVIPISKFILKWMHLKN